MSDVRKKTRWVMTLLIIFLLTALLIVLGFSFIRHVNQTISSESTADTGSRAAVSTTFADQKTSLSASESTDAEMSQPTGFDPDTTGTLAINETVNRGHFSGINQTGENFVIFGVDTRGNNLGAGTRSDSIMIVNVNHESGSVKVASVFRDTMLPIPGYGYEKITHAHSYGGPQLALQALNESLDLDIRNYITVNFINVADIVDQLGGVDQYITEAELPYINEFTRSVDLIRATSSPQIESAGAYRLNGSQAVAYSRIRYTLGADYKRAERQRVILQKIFAKAKEASVATRISIADTMMRRINTNYSTDKAVSMMRILSSYTVSDTGAYPKLFYAGIVEGRFHNVPVTLADMVTGLHGFLFNDPQYSPSDTVWAHSDVLRSKVWGANTRWE